MRTSEKLIGAAYLKKKIIEKLDRDKKEVGLSVADYIDRLRTWIIKLDERDATKAGGLKRKRAK